LHARHSAPTSSAQHHSRRRCPPSLASSPQLEFNEASQQWEASKYELEQRLLEAEGGRLQRHVRGEDHAALADERDMLRRQVALAQDDVERGRAAQSALKREVRQLPDGRPRAGARRRLLPAWARALRGPCSPPPCLPAT
jgi:hypothetical protein